MVRLKRRPLRLCTCATVVPPKLPGSHTESACTAAGSSTSSGAHSSTRASSMAGLLHRNVENGRILDNDVVAGILDYGWDAAGAGKGMATHLIAAGQVVGGKIIGQVSIQILRIEGNS